MCHPASSRNGSRDDFPWKEVRGPASLQPGPAKKSPGQGRRMLDITRQARGPASTPGRKSCIPGEQGPQGPSKAPSWGSPRTQSGPDYTLLGWLVPARQGRRTGRAPQFTLRRRFPALLPLPRAWKPAGRTGSAPTPCLSWMAAGLASPLARGWLLGQGPSALPARVPERPSASQACVRRVVPGEWT